jgi:hypothetical protein
LNGGSEATRLGRSCIQRTHRPEIAMNWKNLAAATLSATRLNHEGDRSCS